MWKCDRSRNRNQDLPIDRLTFCCLRYLGTITKRYIPSLYLLASHPVLRVTNLKDEREIFKGRNLKRKFIYNNYSNYFSFFFLLNKHLQRHKVLLPVYRKTFFCKFSRLFLIKMKALLYYFYLKIIQKCFFFYL